jgi:hypothetical protein
MMPAGALLGPDGGSPHNPRAPLPKCFAKRLFAVAFAPRGSPAVVSLFVPPRREPRGDPRQNAHAAPAGWVAAHRAHPTDHRDPCRACTPQPVLQRLREEGGFTWQRAQRLRDAHLAQGAPTSPALANLCAFRLDLRLAGLAQAFDARYSRYADDIVLSGGPQLRVVHERIERWVGRIAREEGFALIRNCIQKFRSAARQRSVRPEVSKGRVPAHGVSPQPGQS